MGHAGDLADSLSVPVAKMLLQGIKNAEYDDAEICAGLEIGLVLVYMTGRTIGMLEAAAKSGA